LLRSKTKCPASSLTWSASPRISTWRDEELPARRERRRRAREVERERVENVAILGGGRARIAEPPRLAVVDEDDALVLVLCVEAGEVEALGRDVHVVGREGHRVRRQILRQVVVAEPVERRGLAERARPVAREAQPARHERLLVDVDVVGLAGGAAPERVDEPEVGVDGDVGDDARRELHRIAPLRRGLERAIDLQTPVEEGVGHQEAPGSVRPLEVDVDEPAVGAPEVGHEPLHLLGAVERQARAIDLRLDGGLGVAALPRAQREGVVEAEADDRHFVPLPRLRHPHDGGVDERDLEIVDVGERA
jgi:hypothetical protein